MKPRNKRLVLAAGLVLGLSAGVVAHERLRVGGAGAPLFWASPTNIGIVINSTGSDNIADGSHETALRMAIQEWNDVTGTNVALVEDTDPAQQARTDWDADNIHLIWFDETNSSGLFSPGTVAVTPVWFFLNGQIIDADVLFNGRDHQFTTSGAPGRFDVRDVGTHELGHLLGLDHSGMAGATMYPYVDPTTILHRSLALDEVCGLRDISPLGTHGRITGTIQRASDSSPVQGAHVVAVSDAGRTVGSILTGTTGAFTITGLEAGTYTVYADPLDFPVSELNLSAGHVIETDFETTVYGSQAVVPAGGVDDLGVLQVGADVGINLGASFDVYPLRGVQGLTTAHVVRGSGLTAPATLTASDPDLTISAVQWFGNSVGFNLNVPPGEAPGHVDLTVIKSGDVNVLPAAIEITPPSPTVTSVVPGIGATAGGTFVTLTGTNFNAGARVVLGDQIYRDGAPGGCTVVDATTITLTTLPTVGGTHDAVVVDATGVEGRDVGAFQATALPVLSNVFPSAGDSGGGTELVLTGQDFVAGLQVRIDGVNQSTVLYDGPSKVRVLTEPGTPGGPYLLEVENPGGGIASSAYTYVNQPDPTILSTNPNTGGAGGGTTVTISGADLPNDVAITFGVDPDTGLGGTPAASVLWIDANTVEVTTPSHAAGAVAVLAEDASTGQAGVLLGAFTFTSGGGGGGGGGCYTQPFAATPPGPRDALESGGWLALLLLGFALRSLRPRFARVPR